MYKAVVVDKVELLALLSTVSVSVKVVDSDAMSGSLVVKAVVSRVIDE